MSLIRGSGGKFPCPICFVPEDNLADVSNTWPLRTAAHTKKLLKKARSLSKGECESLLSKHGIRNIDVSFLDYFNHAYLLTLVISRMSSGLSAIRTRIARYRSTGYIQTTLGCSGTTYGRGSSCWSIELGATPQRRLINSMFPVLSMSQATNLRLFPQVWSCASLAWATSFL